MSRIFKEYGLAIGIAVVIAMVIRLFVVEAFRIPTAVMQPTLYPGDLIFASKLAYGVRSPWTKESWTEGKTPAYRDVVIFYSNASGLKKNYIKRVVGLPGDRVAIKDGRVELNGSFLDFEPAENGTCGREVHPSGGYTICVEPPIISNLEESEVPEGQVFVVGDLRQRESSDIPYAMIPMQQIYARAHFIWLSIKPKQGLHSAGFLSRFRTHRMFTPVQ